MGFPKLLLAFRGRPLIDWVVDAASAWNPLVVARGAVAAHLRNRGVCIVANDAPECGMAHSLRLANERIAPGAPILVLLGDKPLVSADLIAWVYARSSDADVAFPERIGEPGHPVYLSSRARERLALLSGGDSLHEIKDDDTLVVRPLCCRDEGAFYDVDRPGDLR